MPPGGWYAMHRGWMDSGDFKREPFTEREAFLWSIEQASHKPHRQWFNGAHYEVNRGEFVTSLNTMVEAFGWTIKRVRGFEERMRKVEKWAKRGAHAGAKAPTILAIVNYDKYQRTIEDQGIPEGEENGKRGAKQGQSEGKEQNNGNKGKEGKEGKEENKLGEAPDGATADYAFFGRVIRLAPRHLEEWQRVFHSIPDIVAELASLDAWFELQPEDVQKNWFFRAKQSLNRKHQEILERRQANQQTLPPVWDGMA